MVPLLILFGGGGGGLNGLLPTLLRPDIEVLSLSGELIGLDLRLVYGGISGGSVFESEFTNFSLLQNYI